MKSKKTPNIFSQRLQTARTKVGITWRDLSNKVKISEATLYNYIDGRSPNSDILVRLSIELRVSTDYLLGLSDEPGPAAEPESPPELTVDDHLDRVVSQILGPDISPDLNEEMQHRLKSVLLRERKELRHRNFLRNFESLVELALDAAVDRNDQTEAQKLQQQELVRRNRRRRKLNRFEVQQFLYDYGLIKTKTDAVLHRIENEIMKKRDMVTLGELEDYIREECENQLWLENNPSGAQSAG